MVKTITKEVINKSLDFAYEQAINGVPFQRNAQELAEDYLSKNNSVNASASSLIKWHCAQAGASGVITGVGGLITSPVSIPANLASVMYIQLRMIAAIAHMGGFDVKCDQVKTMSFVCITGRAASDMIKKAGADVAKQLTKQAIKNIPGKTLIEINKQVGFRLFTKFGEKGVVNLGKGIPAAGAIFGGAFDWSQTKIIGNTAKKWFVNKPKATDVYDDIS